MGIRSTRPRAERSTFAEAETGASSTVRSERVQPGVSGGEGGLWDLASRSHN